MIKNSLIFVLLCIAIFLLFDNKNVTTITKTKIDTLITYETFTKITKGDKIPYKILDTIKQTIHDTSYIIANYSEVKEFIDTIKEGKNTFTIRDTISQNKIIGRSFQAQIQEKTITITNNVVQNHQPALYIGVRSDLTNNKTKVNYNINISFKTAKKGLFSVGYGMSGLSVGYSIKL